MFYRFCPPNFGYGRGYLGNFEDIRNELTPPQQAVLQPPFANRLDRLEIQSDMTVTVNKRSDKKKAFDKGVFGCDYF